MKRRRLLLSLPCALALPARAEEASEVAWPAWKATYLDPEGRVIDDANGGISHSEGQAYGLLIAQALGDREAFARIERWTRANLVVREDALMAWKWPQAAPADQKNATDGDLLRAWALLRATRDSGWSEQEGKAAGIAQALARACLAPDPRAPEERLLKPASQSTAVGDMVLVNPSYYMIRALLELGEAYGLPDLKRAASHGERLLSDPSALRDWIAVTPNGIEPAPGLSIDFGWDALRIPLYLFWSGRRTHPALRMAQARFAAATLSGHVATVTDPAGRPLGQSNAAGFLAVAALANQERPPPPAPGQGYYADTLSLLAQIAWREGI